MNAIQTKVAIIHYQRNYGNHSALCSDPRSEPLKSMELSTNTDQVTCKNCVKRFKTIGITPGKVRKLTPRHLGRLSEDERKAQEAGTKIHACRKLRQMIDEATPDLLTPDQAIKVFKNWLRDVAHEFRMKNELDEQATVERIIEQIGE